MAASPLVVDITPLKRQPGKQQPFTVEMPAMADLGLASAEVQADTLTIDLALEFAGEDLIASGQVTIAWHGPCRRCLEVQNDNAIVDVHEIFEKVPVDGETYVLDEDDVDLEPMVREAVLLNLPVAPLCRQDCAGPDPDRFPTSVADDAEDDDAEPPLDPRWAALGEITFDD